jgi:plasmid stability protein
MPEPVSEKFPLTLHLPAELAKRLSVAAAAQHRSAADLVLELLRRHLPPLPADGTKKSPIPYT